MQRKRLLGIGLLIGVCGLGWWGYRNLHQAELNHRLILAASGGDPSTVRTLLKQGADPNAREDSSFGSPFQRFLDRLFGHKHSDVSFYPLSAALQTLPWDANRIEVIRLLVEHKANPSIMVNNGRVPASRSVLENTPDASLLALFLAHDANPNIVADSKKTSLLMYAEHVYGQRDAERMYRRQFAKQSLQPASANAAGDISAVQVLLEHGANPDTANAYGDVPLMWAAFYGDTKSVALLLAHGANVNSKNKKAQSALLYALANPGMRQADRHAIVEKLLAAGADVNAQDLQGGSPFLYALLLQRPEEDLMFAKGGDLHRAMLQPLSDRNLDIEIKTENSSMGMGLGVGSAHGMTLLMFAAQVQDADLVRKILAQGTDVNVRDKTGQNALSYAAGKPEIRKLLLNAGAHP